MNSLPFSRPGRFYRGNLHLHSTNSDGLLSAEDVIRLYQQNGYDFLAITDHFREVYCYPITDTSSFRSDEFTTLFGTELHVPALENGEIWHILAVGMPLDIAPPLEGETGPEIARRAYDTGAFVGVAHPAWYGASLNDIRSIDTAHAIEVYNESCFVDNDRGESWYATDLLLEEGYRVTAFATDDAHFRDTHPDYFGGWVMVKAEQLTPGAVLDALKQGSYYSSQGPMIHDIQVDRIASRISIQCSAVDSVFVTGRASRFYSRHGRSITECQFPLDKFEGNYCRVTIMDCGRKRAWSNPIWLDG